MKVLLTNNIGFNAYHGRIDTPCSKSAIGVLRHSSRFFRYPDEDQANINELEKMQEANDRPLNILSAGCSYGEEVYSYALALNHLKYKPNIIGVDLGKDAIKCAKEGNFFLSGLEHSILDENASQRPEEYKTPYYDEMRKRFHNAFTTQKNCTGHLADKDLFQNCSFYCGNILGIDRRFKNNPLDMILCRYVLYHLDDEELERFAKNAYKALNTGGLLCLDKNSEFAYSTFEDAGFI